MSVIVPFNRRDFVLRPSVSLLPLPARAAAEPVLAVTAREIRVDVAQVQWTGGITLVAGLAGEGLFVTVRARPDAPEQVARLVLLGGAQAAEGDGEVSLRVRVPRALMVAAIAHHADGRLTGALAELRMSA